ncbi:MAG TPA: RNA polymerase sigma factor [Alphaproteobacteria bacterium]|nr:RNA polymerase sigma factor [Alphaproteobacteria bacterium]
MNPEDTALLPRLLRNEAAAYRTLVERHHGALRRLARAIVGDALAEEVAQETWIKAIAALPSFEGRSSLRSWLLRIARNEAIDRLRKESRTGESESLEDEVLVDRFAPDGHWRPPPAIWSHETPEALLATRELAAVIDAALHAMPARQRSVLTLRDMDGLDFDEICNILDIPASSVRVLLHRARQRLWMAIDAHERK